MLNIEYPSLIDAHGIIHNPKGMPRGIDELTVEGQTSSMRIQCDVCDRRYLRNIEHDDVPLGATRLVDKTKLGAM